MYPDHLPRLRTCPMNHSTNLVRVCRDSGLSGSDIEAMVRALDAGRRVPAEDDGAGIEVTRRARLLMTATALARSLWATLH